MFFGWFARCLLVALDGNPAALFFSFCRPHAPACGRRTRRKHPVGTSMQCVETRGRALRSVACIIGRAQEYRRLGNGNLKPDGGPQVYLRASTSSCGPAS